MVLKPQDILVLLKLVAMGRKPWSYAGLGAELGMSPSQLHAAVKRALAAQLAVRRGDMIIPELRNLEEFLTHGLKYVFVPEHGAMTRGVPTAHAAPPLAEHFGAAHEPPPVWPDPRGEARGPAFSPLYGLAPKAARSDPRLYELLVLVDAIRSGGTREREFAVAALHKRLGSATERQGDVGVSEQGTIVIGDGIRVSRQDLRKLSEAHHISRLVLFGSAARGELRPDSDIDLLVEFEAGRVPSLGGMVELQEALSRLFAGRKVDVATRAVLNNPYRRREIEKDMEELYAA